MSFPEDVGVKREPSDDAPTPGAMSDVRSHLSASGDDTDRAAAEAVSSVKLESINEDSGSASASPKMRARSSSASSTSSDLNGKPKAETNSSKDEKESIGGEISVKVEPGKPPKLTRTTSQKVVARAPQLFNHLPDATDEATSSFSLLDACTYANKYMGYTEHAMECDCSEEWDSETKTNTACGEDSDCINRATKMECTGDCGCGSDCQNMRFQKRQYANVSVIKTEKKGYGLRANVDMKPNELIFEYIGEVINEAHFRRRTIQYDEEGIKHFYFMSLSKGEFVDATKRGNLGRFCNHSCNPNCYVDKWVVGEKLRMGIFTERKIVAGEELVFNYNVDRYGADPQPCYCGEPNCTGFIGGKTQTERATKLSNATIEALGIEDGDGWDTAVAKRPRKKKAGEDDEEYVDRVEPKGLDEDGVTKVMAALLQCKEKWIAVKLLSRIQRCEDERVRTRVVKMHGYQILNFQLARWKEDTNIVLQILDILDRFPRLTRNKIVDSKIEATIKPLLTVEDERVVQKASALLEVWATLEIGYRIPRMKRDPNAVAVNHFDRREKMKDDSTNRPRSRSRSKSPPQIPSGPRNGPHSQSRAGPPIPKRRPLPKGWFAALDESGRTYYYSIRNQVTWVRPTQPCFPPPAQPKAENKERSLQDIIDHIMKDKNSTPDKRSTPNTPQPGMKTGELDKKKEKWWESISVEKRMKFYENAINPHVVYVMNKFRKHLPRDDLKRLAKEISKKIVAADFKHNKVEDPKKVSDHQARKIKNHCKEYFQKAATKYKARRREKKQKEKEKRAAEAAEAGASSTTGVAPEPEIKKDEDSELEDDNDEEVKLSDDEGGDDEEVSPENADTPTGAVQPNDNDESQETSEVAPPPPPPPPPPGTIPDDQEHDPEVEFENDQDSPNANEHLKRKRESNGDDESAIDRDHGSATPGKRLRSMSPSNAPPAPPPPPPVGADDAEDTAMEEEQEGSNGVCAKKEE